MKTAPAERPAWWPNAAQKERAEAAHRETAARKAKRQEFTPEEKEAYRKEQRDKSAEMMKAAVAELQTSEGWQAWASMRARLHKYSFANTMLILVQMPEASVVASGKFWKDHGRMMLKGSTALRVNAPLMRLPRPEEIAAGHPADRKIVYGYKLVPVFDISQTEGDDLPTVEHQPLTGDSHAAYLRPLEVLAQSLGFSVSFEDLYEGLGGYCDHARKHIAVSKAEAVNGQVRVLIHEIAHALGIGYAEYGREAAEVLVETATFIVATNIGFDTSGSSVPYVASWGKADATASMERFAADVDKVARTIERAVKDAEVTA